MMNTNIARAAARTIHVDGENRLLGIVRVARAAALENRWYVFDNKPLNLL